MTKDVQLTRFHFSRLFCGLGVVVGEQQLPIVERTNQCSEWESIQGGSVSEFIDLIRDSVRL